MLRVSGFVAEHLREGMRELARLAESGPLTRNLIGQPTGGPSSSGLTRAIRSSKSVAKHLLQPRLHAVAASKPLVTTTAWAKKSLASWASSGR